MKHSLFLTIAAVGLAIAPMAHAAPLSPEVIETVSANVLDSKNMLGAPDNSFGAFLDKEATITFDFGEDTQGSGDLTIYFELLEHGASARVDFLDHKKTIIATANKIFAIGKTTHTFTNESDLPYQFVRITSPEEEVWKLDALEVEGIDTTANDPVEEQPAEPEESTSSVPQGLLVKLVDDGDPATTVDAAVYVIGEEGKRHAFPSSAVYHSWFENFDNVAFIDKDNLASYPLGKNVTVRPGTHLVKLTTDPKTYAVEPGGVLRWITSEEIAIALYGSEWAKRVIDVSDVFFGNYTIGDPIESAIHPDGTLGVDLVTGEVRYVENGLSYKIPGDIHAAHRFQKDFQAPINAGVTPRYLDGGTLTAREDIRFPF